MFFVVSTGRSGSQTIADLLSQSPNAICIHEAAPMLIVESAAYLYGDLPHEEAVQRLRDTRSPLKDGQHFGESNLNFSTLIPALHDAFPEAKFVWLIRDGRDTVASFYARSWYKPFMGPQHRNPTHYHMRHWETARIRADEVGVMTRRQWLGLSRFEKCCWHWAYKNGLMEEMLKTTECQWIMVALENLDERAGELFDWLAIEPPTEQTVKHLNQARADLGQNPLHWTNWNNGWTSAFEHFCGEGMDEWYPGWREGTSWATGQNRSYDPFQMTWRRRRRITFDPLVRWVALRSTQVRGRLRRIRRRRRK